MTPEEMRVAVAEACGWTDVGHGVGPNRNLWLGNKPIAGGLLCDQHVPNYPEDLNACHEMEKVLKGHQVNDYTHRLIAVTQASGVADGVPWLNTYALYHSTPAQRCEAFLRTVKPELFKT